MRSILAALLLCSLSACVGNPAFAQVGLDSIFQGPWNQNAAVGTDRPHRAVSRSYSAAVIGSRPSGCPHAYCGCASARYVGLSGSQWNLAANWLRLPRAAPGPGMAAARRGHVKIIIGSAGGGRWKFYDPNSGGGRTRITVGSLAGFTVVNPHGAYSGRSYSAVRKMKRWQRRR